MEKEMQDHEAEGNENSENPQKFEAASGKRGVNEEKMNDPSVIVGIDKSRKDENLKAEKDCRICHLGNEKTISGSSEVISLGCDCKGELGFSHRHCAETWFGQRENRLCEICGKTVKNITNNLEDNSIFMMEWNEMRLAATTLDTSQESSHRGTNEDIIVKPLKSIRKKERKED
ncbi:uncharacterized protein Fot_21661 [Forsythia ovata]|uniref:RING-CH-type domain-containing protein n=1 Tax=Forsythia ovata TaxID=205694 RepID=A0ABD1UVG8_9LAMI